MELVGDKEATETAKFLLMFDRFFDCLNVSNFDDGKHQRKPFREPFRTADDFRLKVQVWWCIHTKCITSYYLQWLQGEFLAYLTDWERYVMNIKGVSKKAKKCMLLSPQTLLGLKITGKYTYISST